MKPALLPLFFSLATALPAAHAQQTNPYYGNSSGYGNQTSSTRPRGSASIPQGSNGVVTQYLRDSLGLQNDGNRLYERSTGRVYAIGRDGNGYFVYPTESFVRTNSYQGNSTGNNPGNLTGNGAGNTTGNRTGTFVPSRAGNYTGSGPGNATGSGAGNQTGSGAGNR